MKTHHETETNPHFIRPQRVSFEPDFPGDQQNLQPTTTAPRRGRERRSRHSTQSHHRSDQPPEGQHPPTHIPLLPLHPQHPDEQRRLELPHPPVNQHPPAPDSLQPLHAQHPDEQHRLKPPRGSPQQQDPFHRRRGGGGGGGGVVGEGDDNPLLVPPRSTHSNEARDQDRHDGGGGGPRMPQPRRTGAHTWFLAVFCAILWVVVILGGLVVLVVYLVFRPRSPRFEVSAATLNAAYLDGGYLLNADLTLLANFTNPNRKVGIEFSYMYTQLYYGRTLVATQYLEPFTARRGRNTFASLHMVTSQVRLAELEIQRIKRQSLNNNIVFELRGYFRAKSNFGRLLRYSYWLHSRCTIVLTRPPGGVLVARRCKTSH